MSTPCSWGVISLTKAKKCRASSGICEDIWSYCATIGTCVNVIDTGISLAQLILTTHILLISPDPTAISNIIKSGPHPGQPFSLSFRQKADILLSLCRNLKIQIVWAPQDHALHGFVCAKHLTDTIALCPHPLPPNHCEPHTVSYQCREAKASAIDTWADRCLSNNRRSQTTLLSPRRQMAKSHR
jgi:hypothetical protein